MKIIQKKKEKFEFTTSIPKTFFHLFFLFPFYSHSYIKKSLVLSRNPPFFLFYIYIQIISTRDFRNAKKIIPFHLCSLSAISLYPLHSINSLLFFSGTTQSTYKMFQSFLSFFFFVLFHLFFFGCNNNKSSTVM